jgi:hypothetical protein
MGRETGSLHLLAPLLLTGGKGADLVIRGNVVLNKDDQEAGQEHANAMLWWIGTGTKPSPSRPCGPCFWAGNYTGQLVSAPERLY